MVKKTNRSEVRENKHRRIRSRLSGTPEKPRLAVFRSNNHMYAQVIDDVAGNTIVSASTLQADVNLAKLLLRKLWIMVSRQSYSTVEDTFTRVK